MSVPSDFALDILMMEMFSFLLGGNILLESQLKAISFQSALLTYNAGYPVEMPSVRV